MNNCIRIWRVGDFNWKFDHPKYTFTWRHLIEQVKRIFVTIKFQLTPATFQIQFSINLIRYDKRDDFNFKIINFKNMSSNIPASPAYGVYISQLIRYARASSNYSDFLKRHLHLRNRLLDQGYKKKIRLIRSLKKFIFRYQDLVEIYSVSAEKIINDGFSYSENV
jgi:hypothetical protein